MKKDGAVPGTIAEKADMVMRVSGRAQAAVGGAVGFGTVDSAATEASKRADISCSVDIRLNEVHRAAKAGPAPGPYISEIEREKVRNPSILNTPDDDDRANKERYEKELNDEFERRCYVTMLKDEDFVDIFGMEWKTRPEKGRVDLSLEKYKLETLTGPPDGGEDSFQGLLDKNLLRNKIVELRLCKNALHDINILQASHGFTDLVILMARQNYISNVSLTLPRLMELNLAYNALTTIPDLKGMPNLQDLILSHNRLAGSFDCLSRNKHLRRIDLAFNQYELLPSELKVNLDALELLASLTKLRLFGNPFVINFSEYQVFIVRKLKTLVRLDDMDITSILRDEVTLQKNLLALECYDDQVMDRRKRESDKSKGEHIHVSAASVSRLKQLVQKFDDVMDDSSVLVRNVEWVHAEAKDFTLAIHSCLKDDMATTEVEDSFWLDLNSDAEQQNEIRRFLELIVAIMERHDSVRHNIIEILSFLTCVHGHDMGRKCIKLIGTMMISGYDYQQEGLRVLDAFIVPNLKAFGELKMNSEYSEQLMLGLTDLLSMKRIQDKVSATLESIVHIVVDKLKQLKNPDKIVENQAVIQLLEAQSSRDRW